MNKLSHTDIALELERPIWFSGIRNMQQDIHFIKVLLRAKIYKQGIPNLFENLILFKSNIESFSEDLKKFKNEVCEFSRDSKELSLQKDPSFEKFKNTKYKQFISEYLKLDSCYLKIKCEIFNYLERVLPQT